MEVRIHGLVARGVHLAEGEARRRLPGPIAGLEVTAHLPISRGKLQEVVGLEGQVEGGSVPGGAVVLGEGVDGKSLAIDHLYLAGWSRGNPEPASCATSGAVGSALDDAQPNSIVTPRLRSVARRR